MSGLGIDKQKIDLLKQFVSLCKANPSILQHKELSFMKDWLVNDLKANLGGSNDDQEKEKEEEPKSYAKAAEPPKPESSEEDDSDMEIDEVPEPDIDMSDVVEADTEFDSMGEDGRECSEEDMDKVMELRSRGMGELSSGNLKESVKTFTEAIDISNSSTVLFVKRATAYVRMKRPNAAIRDAQKALEINPDSVPALKVLGKAEKLLGKWDLACKHFQEAQKIDYDGDIAMIIKEIQPKATKLREYNLLLERNRREKELNRKLKRARKIKKAQQKAREEQEKRKKDSNFSFQGGFPGQMPGGMGGQMPGGGNFDFQKMFNDPEFMKKFANMQQPQGGSDQSGQSDKKPTNQGEEPKVFEVPTDDLD